MTCLGPNNDNGNADLQCNVKPHLVNYMLWKKVWEKNEAKDSLQKLELPLSQERHISDLPLMQLDLSQPDNWNSFSRSLSGIQSKDPRSKQNSRKYVTGIFILFPLRIVNKHTDSSRTRLVMS